MCAVCPHAVHAVMEAVQLKVSVQVESCCACSVLVLPSNGHTRHVSYRCPQHQESQPHCYQLARVVI